MVLISDDEPLLVQAIARQFRRLGLSYISDTTSEHVLKLARDRQPDVIVLDIRQRIDGRDLLSQLKKDPLTRHIRVIVLSAVDDQFNRRLCLELGAEDYEVKPFDGTFLHKVARLAERGAHEREH